MDALSPVWSLDMPQETDIPPQDRVREGQAFDGLLSYQLSMVSTQVSRALVRLLSERFDLTVSEWRIMVVLGRFPGVSAIDVCDITGMDKVQVSRAVGRLMERNHLERTQDPQDRRRARLRLSASGHDLHARVVPVAEGYEARVLKALSPVEIESLSVILNKIAKGLGASKESNKDNGVQKNEVDDDGFEDLSA